MLMCFCFAVWVYHQGQYLLKKNLLSSPAYDFPTGTLLGLDKIFQYQTKTKHDYERTAIITFGIYCTTVIAFLTSCGFNWYFIVNTRENIHVVISNFSVYECLLPRDFCEWSWYLSVVMNLFLPSLWTKHSIITNLQLSWIFSIDHWRQWIMWVHKFWWSTNIFMWRQNSNWNEETPYKWILNIYNKIRYLLYYVSSRSPIHCLNLKANC